MSEMPLVFFTVLSQLAAGGIITVWLLEVTGKKLSIATGKLATASFLMLSGFSILISLFHLGHPLEIYKVVLNLGSSWLSREAVIFFLLLVLLAIYYFQWKEGREKNRRLLGGITALIALLAVISSAMIYVLPARPAWNNFSTVAFFLLTSALLGPLYVGMLFTLKDKRTFNLPVVLISVISISIISYVSYVSMLVSGTGTAYLTGTNILTSSAFWGKVILSWLVPLSLLIIQHLRNQKLNYLLITIILLSAFIGEVLGRELFYSSIVALQIAAL